MTGDAPAPARVLLGICGSIAAYKGADLCSKLVQRGFDVTVMMTHAATRLVGPLTFSALTGRDVATDLFRGKADGVNVEHITLADRADVVIIAPATGNLIAKAAHGLADDLITSTLLAVRCPVLLAPAMNVNMWEHPATQRNLKLVAELGYRVIEPEDGYLACGWQGKGRLAEPAHIADQVAAAVAADSGA